MTLINKDELQRIHILFKSCVPLFLALGDEVRQKLILDIADAGVEGINVTNLSAKSKLSRPAISHHLKVLKDCGLISPCKEGTQIFYRFNVEIENSLSRAGDLIKSVQNIISQINK